MASVSVHKISRCILPLLCFSSVHREKCQTRPPFNGFTQLCTSVSMFTMNADNCLFLCSCLCVHVGSLCLYRVSVFISGLQSRHQIHHRHGQYPNPANLQCCCSTEAETGFRSNICAVFCCRHFLDTEVSILNSFLYPKVPRVNVFRSLSCSQSIRQRIRRRAVTLYFNLSLEVPDPGV